MKNNLNIFRQGVSALLASAICLPLAAKEPIPVSPLADKAAAHAVSHYQAAMAPTLARLVRFDTRAREGQTPLTDPAFIGFKAEMKALAAELGLSFEDRGYVLLLGLGEADAKLGVITHGDVQPADPSQWLKSPWELDTQSEPGHLIGRGTEDDKGPIVTALYAMKSIKELNLPLERRIELLVYLAEESDWDPLREFLKTYTPADINITLDAEYPVVTAEKGWSQIQFIIPRAMAKVGPNTPVLKVFEGGSFASQVPQLAHASIQNADEALLQRLKARAEAQKNMRYQFELQQGTLDIRALGRAAHSSTPEAGVNAVAHLAEVLKAEDWPQTHGALTAQFVAEMVGLGLYGDKFGKLAYSDAFMGPMSLAVTLVKPTENGVEVTINLRRPEGRTPEQMDTATQEALSAWSERHGVQLEGLDTYWGAPHVVKDAPHLETLLGVFSHFTGITNPKPVAIGGSTNAKLFPNALSFGPAMPGVEYTGHSEHEFITEAQLKLNLEMYTAAMVELAVKGAAQK
ncbi:dipeptidase [Shewanella cyperi]|uniref:Dipeptidase n=1 Tax=Shewanella cyperi TaxID=2814292 RepID=A0A975AJH2_9GAMM|nr:dipeptidase [Shewanella cyperi]QSX28711.1 dipeptidase [Shewanella cyperi]